MLTPRSKAIFHRSLIELRKLAQNQKVPIPSLGLCSNLSYLLDKNTRSNELRVDALMKDLLPDWPMFSGSLDYPVPSPLKGQSSEKAYDTANRHTMWYEGEYAEYRLELLDYLIEKTGAENESA